MNYRRTLTRIVTFLGGLYFFLEFVLPGEFLGIKISAHDEEVSNGFITVGVMAIGLGIFNILAIHGSKIAFRRKGWGNSVALLIGLAMMLVVTFLDWRSGVSISSDVERVFLLRDFADRIRTDADAKTEGVLPYWERNKKLAEAAVPLFDQIDRDLASVTLGEGAISADQDLFNSLIQENRGAVVAARASVAALPVTESPIEAVAQSSEAAKVLSDLGSTRLELLNLVSRYSTGKKLYDFLYTGLFQSLGAAMFSLLGFYIASAAYRAFRVRSGESALMMASAFVVMLGQIPFGLKIWSGFPAVRLWLLKTPSAAAFRAIKIGAGVASLVMAYRMWFSIESEKFSKRRNER